MIAKLPSLMMRSSCQRACGRDALPSGTWRTVPTQWREFRPHRRVFEEDDVAFPAVRREARNQGFQVILCASNRKRSDNVKNLRHRLYCSVKRRRWAVCMATPRCPQGLERIPLSASRLQRPWVLALRSGDCASLGLKPTPALGGKGRCGVVRTGGVFRKKAESTIRVAEN